MEERDGNQELRQRHPTKAWISICLSHTGEKKQKNTTTKRSGHQLHPAALWMCFSQADGGKGKSEEEEGREQVQDKPVRSAN